jgi:hypothetical protein
LNRGGSNAARVRVNAEVFAERGGVFRFVG